MSQMSSWTCALCCKRSVKTVDEFTVSIGEWETDVRLSQSFEKLMTHW